MESNMQKLQLIAERLVQNSISPDDVHQMLADDVHDTARDDNHIPAQPTEASGNWGVVMDYKSGPGAIPGFHIAGKQARVDVDSQEGFISRGVATVDSARSYFEQYKNRLDHFPYRILNHHTAVTFESVWRTSTLLTPSVCAVGAPHSASEDFEVYYQESMQSSAQKILYKQYTVDDVRSLCISAFWLSDLSWSLVGAAVRIATELQLHRIFSKAMKGDRQYYLQAE